MSSKACLHVSIFDLPSNKSLALTHSFYRTGYYTGLGACGWWSNDGEMVAAVPDHVYDNFPGATPEWDTSEQRERL